MQLRLDGQQPHPPAIPGPLIGQPGRTSQHRAAGSSARVQQGERPIGWSTQAGALDVDIVPTSWLVAVAASRSLTNGAGVCTSEFAVQGSRRIIGQLGDAGESACERGWIRHQK